MPVEGTPVVDWSLKLIWALEPGGADQPGVIWCGTLPGGLFKSEDGGDSWALNRAAVGRSAPRAMVRRRRRSAGHPLDLRRPARFTTREDRRVVRRRVDHARRRQQWELTAKGMRATFMPPDKQFEENVQDPHMVAQCRSNPDVLWVQHHNGIFKSDDGAATWTEITDITPSSFGFAVAVHPNDPDIAWFVPGTSDEKRCPIDGRVVVNRTRDGGKTFETITRGLPQQHAYDLVFRHALDVDDDGRTLIFGSTTGSLWVSEDGGDSWQALSSHLPPVYAVTFEKTASVARRRCPCVADRCRARRRVQRERPAGRSTPGGAAAAPTASEVTGIVPKQRDRHAAAGVGPPPMPAGTGGDGSEIRNSSCRTCCSSASASRSSSATAKTCRTTSA